MEKHKFKIKTWVALVEASFWGLIGLPFLHDISWIQNISLDGNIKGLMIFIIVSLSYYFLVSRNAELCIDEEGVSFKENIFFSFVRNFTWNKYQLIEIDKTKPANNLWYMKAGENTLYFLDAEKGKATHEVNLNWYQNIDRKKFEEIYKLLKLDTKVMTEEDYVNDFNPNTIDLGKKAGLLAYSSLGLVVIAAIIGYVDEYKTIDFGYLGYATILIGICIAFLCWKYLTREEEMIETNWLVVCLFSSIFSLTSMFALVSVLTQFGTSYKQTFVYKKVNKYNEAIWENQENDTFWCRVSDGFSQSNKQVEVVKSMSMARVHISQACPK